MAIGGVSGEARVVVGLDFGTTFSGFAYAHRSNPNQVKKFFEWPDEGANPSYCKTETSLFYQREEGGGDRYYCTEWGWSAHRRHSAEADAAARASRKRKGSLTPADLLDQSGSGKYITKFKLHLAGQEHVSKVGPLTSAPLPTGITAERAITDYLSQISAFILKILQDTYGNQLTMEEVQWCLTVPAIWNDVAKLKMKTCAEKAGMVAGYHTPANTVTSRYPLKIVLEPEAAAFYCWNQACYKDLNVQRGHHLLVADIGGGTADIVVHEKATDGSDFSVNEVDASSGGLCGGSYVDESFFQFIGRRISCLDELLSDNPRVKVELLKRWNNLKSEFQGTSHRPVIIDVPQSLATAWKKYDDFKEYEPRESYEELELTAEDLIEIFRPCVDEIIRLINEKMTAQVKVLMVVGGFSASPYLMRRLKDAFSYRVSSVINPPDPGAAIACGAVLMGMGKYERAAVQSASPSSSGRFNLGAGAGGYQILSRVAKKTYGIKINLPFQDGIHMVMKRWQNDEGILMCNDLFDMFVSKGQRLEAETHVITREYGMPTAFVNAITVSLFCTDAVAPNLPLYTTDVGVTCVGRFTLDVTDGVHMGASRKILVTMHFGTSVIEVKGARVNFGNTSQVESFQVHYDDVSFEGLPTPTVHLGRLKSMGSLQIEDQSRKPLKLSEEEVIIREMIPETAAGSQNPCLMRHDIRALGFHDFDQEFHSDQVLVLSKSDGTFDDDEPQVHITFFHVEAMCHVLGIGVPNSSVVLKGDTIQVIGAAKQEDWRRLWTDPGYEKLYSPKVLKGEQQLVSSRSPILLAPDLSIQPGSRFSTEESVQVFGLGITGSDLVISGQASGQSLEKRPLGEGGGDAKRGRERGHPTGKGTPSGGGDGDGNRGRGWGRQAGKGATGKKTVRDETIGSGSTSDAGGPRTEADQLVEVVNKERTLTIEVLLSPDDNTIALMPGASDKSPAEATLKGFVMDTVLIFKFSMREDVLTPSKEMHMKVLATYGLSKTRAPFDTMFESFGWYHNHLLTSFAPAYMDPDPNSRRGPASWLSGSTDHTGDHSRVFETTSTYGSQATRGVQINGRAGGGPVPASFGLQLTGSSTTTMSNQVKVSSTFQPNGEWDSTKLAWRTELQPSIEPALLVDKDTSSERERATFAGLLNTVQTDIRGHWYILRDDEDPPHYPYDLVISREFYMVRWIPKKGVSRYEAVKWLRNMGRTKELVIAVFEQRLTKKFLINHSFSHMLNGQTVLWKVWERLKCPVVPVMEVHV